MLALQVRGVLRWYMKDSITAIEAAEFQDTILRSLEQHIAPYVVKLKGRDYALFPQVFNPNYAKASILLLDNLGVREGDVVLDPFTGCGADAIFAVLEGASRAVAIDKFTMPYLCARYNAYMLGLEDRVDVRQGDLFDPLRKDEKFDLIIANPPFKDIEPQTTIESAVRDFRYNALKRFFSDVDNYLKSDGRIRMVFSNVGDRGYLNKLIKDNNFKSRIIARDKYAAKVIIDVHEIIRV